MKVYTSSSSHPHRLEGGLRTRGNVCNKPDLGNPLVSIITVVYHGEKHIEQTVQSVLNQTYKNIEYIVIDGGSTDATIDILRKYDRKIACWVSEPDKGIYDAMNKGIGCATGEVIGILNADDRYHDAQVLHDVLEAFRSDSAVDAVYGDLVYVDGDRVVRYWRGGRPHMIKYYLGWIPPHPTFFVRREVYEESGVFDTQFPIVADYEFMLRTLVRYRINIVYIPRVLVRMAVGGASSGSVRDILRNNMDIMRSWRTNDLRWGHLVPVLKPAQKAVQFVRRPSGDARRLDPFP